MAAVLLVSRRFVKAGSEIIFVTKPEKAGQTSRLAHWIRKCHPFGKMDFGILLKSL